MQARDKADGGQAELYKPNRCQLMTALIKTGK
jgi:hypothetical protein